MITVGYIGNGKSANRYHLPFVLQRPDKFHVKAIYNPRVHHDKWAKIQGITYTENLADIMDDPEINLVVVCTLHNDDLHYKYTKMALEKGKNCLCEKPFMASTEQTKEIFELAKSKGLVAQPFHCKRFDSDFLTTQKVIESGVLGEIFRVELHYDYYRPYMTQWLKEYNPLYGIIFGHACHTLDQALGYFGKPQSYTCDARQLEGAGRMNDYYDITLDYGKFVVNLSSNYCCAVLRPSFVVYGKKGTFIKQTKDRQEEHLKLFYMPDREDFGLDLPQHYGVLTYYDGDGVFHEEKVPSERGDYGRIYDDLFDAIELGKPKTIRDEQIMWQFEIMEAAVKDLR